MAQKQPIPSGFDYTFVDRIEYEYLCPICQSVLRSPVQTKCGHKFCKDCLTSSHKKSGKQECPIDREQLTKKQIFSDKATERKILSFKVHCPNQGCTWQGELRDIQSKPVKPGQAVSQNHFDTCPMRVIPCSYKHFGCDFEGPRKSHSEHVITYHLAFTMEKMFSLQEENRQLKLQIETMNKDFETKTKSVKDQTTNLKNQFLAIQQDLNNTNKKQGSDTINLQGNQEETTNKLSVMSVVLVSNTNAIDENKNIATEELERLENELDDIKEKYENTKQHVGGLGNNMGEMRKNISSITDQLSSLERQVHELSEQTNNDLERMEQLNGTTKQKLNSQLSSLAYQVHGISGQTADALGDIRKIQNTTTRLNGKTCSLNDQLEEFSKETKQNMATKSMVYSLEREYSRLDTKCAQRDKNALREIETENKNTRDQIQCLTGTLRNVKYALIVLVMVVAVLWIQSSQLDLK